MGRLHLKNRFRKDRADNEKILPLLLALSMCFVLAACGNSKNVETAGTTGQTVSEEESLAVAEESETLDEVQETDESSNTQQTEDVDADGTKILVAYFSRTGENYSVGYIEKGNTHIIADMIAGQVDADTLEISTVMPYPDDCDECTEVAKQEQEENARPELAASVEIRGSIAQNSQDDANETVIGWLEEIEIFDQE